MQGGSYSLGSEAKEKLFSLGWVGKTTFRCQSFPIQQLRIKVTGWLVSSVG